MGTLKKSCFVMLNISIYEIFNQESFCKKLFLYLCKNDAFLTHNFYKNDLTNNT